MNRTIGFALALCLLCAPLGVQARHKKKPPKPTPTPRPTPTVTPTVPPTPTPVPDPAQMLTPVPGLIFNASTITFNWSAGNAVSYILSIGNTPNGNDIYFSGQLHTLSATVSNLPKDGRTLYVMLTSLFSSSYATNNYTYTASAPEVKTPFDMGSAGELKADPIRNRVYLIDQTTPRILAIDTDTGQIAAAAALEGLSAFLPVYPANNGNVFSKMEIPFDGSKLYVGVPAAKEIQVFSLPDLAPLGRLPSIAPWSLAKGSNGRLFAYSADPGGICEIDTSTGLVLHGFQGPGPGAAGTPLLLRNNAAGTRLYGTEVGVYVEGGPGYMYEYDTSGTIPTLIAQHPLNMVYVNDFAVDEQYQRLYSMNGGIYGIEQTDLVTDSYGSVWPIGDYAVAVTFLPGATIVYGGSGGTTQSTIRKYNRADGTPLGDKYLSSGKAIMSRALAITPNGKLIYAANFWHGCVCAFHGWDYYVGIIGRDSMVVDNAPSNGGPANPTLYAANFSDAEGNNDGIPNAGEIVSFSPSLLNNGIRLAPNAFVDVAVSWGGALLSSTTQTYGNIPAGTIATLAPFRIQLDSTLASRSTVTVTFTAHWDSGQSKSFPYTIVIQ